jgi:CDP-glucose 4,6-dehydratase
MRYLVTGHTGFKGAWLTLMLTERGHEVCGLSLDPEPGSLFEIARVGELTKLDIRGDIRDADIVRDAVTASNPDVVIHMAAQPLVRESYADPRWTMETNVMGTFNVLEAVQKSSNARAQLIITTDKVYRNVNQEFGYIENDALGGHDPYSASKAMADLLTQSWVASYDTCPTAIARAGNVIGGGDVSTDRLMPDLLRSFASGQAAILRAPEAVRPWQHVLDCLNGYLLLVDGIMERGLRGSWNFGPDDSSMVSVGQVADIAASLWGGQASWSCPPGEHPHEAALLTLNASRARNELAWSDKLTLEEGIAWTVEWERHRLVGNDPRAITLEQIRQFAAIV